MKLFLYSVLLASFLVSCSSSTEKVTQSKTATVTITEANYQFTDSINHYTIDLIYPVIDGAISPTILTQINNVILEKFHFSVDQESFIAAHQNLPSDFIPEDSDWTGDLTNTYKIHQADSFLFISFSVYQYYLGAAHGFSTNEVIIFNINSGQELKGTNFIKSDKESLNLIVGKINTALPDSVCWGIPNDSNIISHISNLYFIKDTIVFQIEDYELCPYAFGAPEMKFSINEVKPSLIFDTFSEFKKIETKVAEGEIASH
jgi:hypothetical protein